jgi:hypothetical protein
MANKNPNTRASSIAKRAAIKEEYEKWNAKKEGKVRMYTFEYIMLKIAQQFFISPRTAEEIVNGWGYYKEEEPKNQLEMFENDEDAETVAD